MSKPDLQTQLEIEKRLRSEAYVDWANQVGELHQKIQNLENALLWIADIAAKEHGDPKLRADGARTLRRIITKVEETIRINKEERILEQK